MNMAKKYLLFDFDGTVIDNSEGITACIRYALGKMGVPVPDENTLRRFIGPSLFDSYMNYCEKNEENAARFVELYRERYAPKGYLETRLYDGIKDTLVKLKADGKVLAVCSSKPLEFVEKIAEKLGIHDCFLFFSCPGFATHDSDKRSLIENAVEHFGADKKDVLMIGDTEFDINGANEAEVDSLGVLYGFAEDGTLQKCGATALADSPAEVYRVISEWKN